MGSTTRHQMWKFRFADGSIDFYDVTDNELNYVVRDNFCNSSCVAKHGRAHLRSITETAGGRFAPQTCRQKSQAMLKNRRFAV